MKGYIKGIQSGEVKLMYNENIKGINTDSIAIVKDGSFQIDGTLAQHYPFETHILINNSLITPEFFISPGSQSIQLDVEHIKVSPETNTRAGKENKMFNQRMEPVDSLVYIYWNRRNEIINNQYHRNPPVRVMDSLKIDNERLSLKKDSVLENFIRENPSSYVGLWHLFNRLTLMGYRPKIDTAYQLLNSELKSSFLGKKIRDILYHSKQIQIGATFPKLPLKNIDEKKALFKPENNYKISLIDFWYSHCAPCIAQFNDLKKLYAKYHAKGFEIISISVDRKHDISDWHNRISEYGLAWPQYLDQDQIQALKFGINAFPWNFIINSDGKIMNERVTMIQLKDILQKTFNAN